MNYGFSDFGADDIPMCYHASVRNEIKCLTILGMRLNIKLFPSKSYENQFRIPTLVIVTTIAKSSICSQEIKKMYFSDETKFFLLFHSSSINILIMSIKNDWIIVKHFWFLSNFFFAKKQVLLFFKRTCKLTFLFFKFKEKNFCFSLNSFKFWRSGGTDES